MAYHSGELLEACRNGPGNVCHRRTDLWRNLDAYETPKRETWTKRTGTLHCLQHDAACRIPFSLDRGSLLCGLSGTSALQRPDGAGVLAEHFKPRLYQPIPFPWASYLFSSHAGGQPQRLVKPEKRFLLLSRHAGAGQRRFQQRTLLPVGGYALRLPVP